MRHLKRRDWLAAFVVVEVLSLGLTHLLGRDLNWDFFNYHLYAGLSVFNDRLSQDFFPASVQTYLNPLAYAPLYWMVAHGFTSYAVAAAHAGVHALNPLLLYAITLALMPAAEPHPKSVALVGAALGCASALFIAELGTSFMDLSTAVPVLMAVWLLVIRREDSRCQWFAGTLLGLALGLKLTNIVYALAALGAVVLLAGSVRSAAHAGARLACAFALGFLLSYGVWGWKLYQVFGSPTFPYFNRLFLSPDYEPTSMRFDRFLPPSFVDWLALPLRMAEFRSWVYTEGVAPDLRPLAVLAAALCALLAWGRLKLRKAVPLPAQREDARVERNRRFLLLFVAISYLGWTQTSANGRYGLPWLMLLGPVATVLFYATAPMAVARILLLLLLAGQSVHMLSDGNPRWNPQDWKPTWLQARIPDRLVREPNLYLSMDTQTNSFLAALVHPESAFVNLSGQYSISFGRPGGERVRGLLSEHRGHVRLLDNIKGESPVLGAATVARYDAVLDRILMRLDPNDCVTMSTDGQGSRGSRPDAADPLAEAPGADLSRRWLVSCAVVAKASHDPELADQQRRFLPIFHAFADKCPRLFRPHDALPEGAGRLWKTYFMETGVYLVIRGGDIVYHAERQSGETAIGKVDDWPRALDKFDCNLPRSGSRD
jgi:hypothetical protein